MKLVIDFYILASEGFHFLLTGHGTEAKTLLPIVVVGGSTPHHAIAASIGGAVCVVVTVIQEGELAQGTVGVPTSGCHHDCEYMQRGHRGFDTGPTFQLSLIKKQHPVATVFQKMMS